MPQRFIKFLTCYCILLPLACLASEKDILPPGVSLNWGNETEEVISQTRSKMALDGLWQFLPATTEFATELPSSGWGYIQVPGSWMRENSATFVRAPGRTPLWHAMDWNRLTSVWYQRIFVAPQKWGNKSVSVKFDRIADNADVSLNGYPLGKITRLGGEVDLTNVLRIGQSNVLQVLVSSAPNSYERGLVGEVNLFTRPKDAYIEGVWVRPDTTEKSFEVAVDLAGVPKSGPLTFTVDVKKPDGTLANSYSQVISVDANSESQSITLRFPWEDIDLWDYSSPNLYRMDITVRGVGFFDSFRQSFGFREYHFDRASWFLNDHPFPLRAVMVQVHNYTKVHDYLNAGFSVGLIPQFDIEDPDNMADLENLLNLADSIGFPLVFEVPDNKIDHWSKKVTQLWKKLRNHPSFMLFYSQEIIPHPDGFTEPITQFEMIPMSTPVVAPYLLVNKEDVEQLTEYAARYFGSKSFVYDFDFPPEKPFTDRYSYQYLQSYCLDLTWRLSRLASNLTSGFMWKVALDDKNALIYKTLKRANRPIAAWISGPKDNLVSRDHHFYGGTVVDKCASFINQSFEPVDYEGHWQVKVAQNVVYEESFSGHINVNEVVFLPLQFTIPEVGQRTDGDVKLEIKAGNESIIDQFTFEVFPATPTQRSKAVFLFDPEGDSKALLERLGFRVIDWTGKPSLSNVLVIGRNALSNGEGLPGSIREFLSVGGRVLLLTQNPDWLTRNFSLEIIKGAKHRFWPIVTQKKHPALRDLEDKDFSFWNGRGALLENEQGNTDIWLESNDSDFLPWVWQYGNLGSVSSAPIFKPVVGGWVPVIEGGENLVWTPLLEKHFGKGLMLLCTLDLENRGKTDPVVDRLMVNMVDYLDSQKEDTRPRNIYYIGGREGQKLLDHLSLKYVPLNRLPSMPAIIVADETFEASEKAINGFLDIGGQFVFLARKSTQLPLGFVAKQELSKGAWQLPAWPDLKGISIADFCLAVPEELFVLQSGSGKIAANGLLGLYANRTGRGYFIQIEPQAVGNKGNQNGLRDKLGFYRILSLFLTNVGAPSLTDDRMWGWEIGALERQKESPTQETRAPISAESAPVDEKQMYDYSRQDNPTRLGVPAR